MENNVSEKYDVKEIRRQIRKTRHKAELPLRIAAYIFSALLYLLVGFCGFILNISPETYNQTVEEFGTEDLAEYLEYVDMLQQLGFAATIAIIVVVIVLILFAMYKQYADEMSYSVKVSEKNFPEIYEKSVEFAQKLGLKKVPEVYIQQQNGILNAFSTMVPHRRYVQLNSEIVDVAYMEHKDFDCLAFVMAHEFGHIYLNHVTVWHNLFIIVVRLVPVIGALVSRAMEYSADRVAQVITDNKGSKECMLMLAAGRHLYKYADIDDYLASVNEKHSLIERISRFLVNLFADHPINPFRVKAIVDPDRKSGRLI